MSGFQATAPCRVDLAGGTLDLWPLSQLVEGAVTVNVAIDVLTGCTLELGGKSWTFRTRDGGESVTLARLPQRPEREVPPSLALAAVVAAHFELPPCSIETWSQAGRGSGLGGSSALVVSLIAAAAEASGRVFEPAELVALGCNLETRILGRPAGTQDHWAAVRGGVTILEHGAEGVRPSSAPPGAGAICDALVVADTRVQHHSGMNNWAVFKAFLEGDAGARGALADVARAARTMRDAVHVMPADAQLAAARVALRAEWEARRRLAPAVTSPEVEAIVAAAVAAGGAAKVCGAGGGGCVACLPGPAGRRDLVLALEAMGAHVLEARPTAQGVTCKPV